MRSIFGGLPAAPSAIKVGNVTSICASATRRRQSQDYVDPARVPLHRLSHAQHGRVVSQGELPEHVYGQDFPHDSNAVEVLIARLRKKLGIDFIQTKRGHGYIVGGE